jgi:hypothetical protein
MDKSDSYLIQSSKKIHQNKINTNIHQNYHMICKSYYTNHKGRYYYKDQLGNNLNTEI